MNTIVRETLGAGRWFPGNADELREMLAAFFERAAGVRIKGRVLGGLAPHAGYMYSGRVAALTFRALGQSDPAPETVVILGFSHRAGFRKLALMDGAAVRSPLGTTALDAEAGAALIAACGDAEWKYTPHQGEWSAENEIPFVQFALPSSRLVVGLFGDHDPQTAESVADALVKLARVKKIAVIASSDLLHDPNYERVERTDRATLALIENMNAAGLAQTWRPDHQIVCGLQPVRALIRFAAGLGATKGALLGYRNSGDDFPESRGEWVVGYGSLVYLAA